MLVHALVSSIGAAPEPAILLVLHSLDEVLAHLVGGRPRVAVFTHDNLAQCLLVPFIHGVSLLGLLLGLLSITRVGVKILLGRLALNVQVMAELALAAFVAVALFVVDTEDRLRIDTEGNLLYLHRLEKIGRLLLRLFRGLLLSLTSSLLGFFPLCFRSFVVRGLRL